MGTIDLSAATDENWDDLEDCLESLPNVAVLINNAGVSLEWPQRYLEDDERARDIVEVNVVAVNEITLMALPLMRKHVQDNGGRALVINVSSLSALFPTPLLAVYGASKSFVSSFSAALAAEYEKDGIDVDCPVPFFVISNMSKRKRPTWNCPTPGAFARASLAQAGHGDYVAFSPYWSHSLIEYISQCLPFTERYIIRKSKAMHEDI